MIFNTVNEMQLAIGCALVIAALIALVMSFRGYLAKNLSRNLAEKYGALGAARMFKKFPEADIFRHSGVFLRVGLVASMLFTVMAFGLTHYEEEVSIPEGALEISTDIVQETPRTATPPPPPPPPPPPVIEAVPDEEVTEEVTFDDLSVDDDDMNVDAPVVEEKAEEPAAPPPAPEPEPEPEPVIEEIFTVVEQMPRFPGCEDLSGTDDEKKKCAEQKMLEFIYKNIKYPTIARENGVEGTVVVRFVVEKDGSITDSKVLRDVGAGCGDEALRVVNMMNTEGKKWTPGRQRNNPVRVQFNLPVKFKLEN